MRGNAKASTKRLQWIQLLGLACLLAATPGHSQVNFAKEAACQTLQPASTGGPLPKSPNLLVVRSLGRANYEVAYRGKVLLFDAYYDNSRLSFAEPFGLKQSDITRADAIFVGHTHFDHFGDAPPIARRTGAPVFIGPPGRKYLEALGLPESQIEVVRGGETIKRSGYTVQTALAIHMPADPADGAAWRELMSKSVPLTGKEQQELTEWRKGESDGTHLALAEDPLDPEGDTWHHGTIVYVLTFDDGFRLLFSDTAGVLSGGERALADSIHAGGGKIDLAILGYLQIGFSLPKAIKVTGTRANVWDPSIFIPSHFHDGEKAELPEMPTAPLFEAFREVAPHTRGIEPLYRSPVCIDTKTDDFFVGNYVR
jgi:L-ascorbate metabolism protein UlaG (beta-lactamase superfamily)